MNDIRLNHVRDKVIGPLFDYGVLYAADLLDKVGWDKSLGAFYKLLTRMENDGILKSKRHVSNNKKYVYLTKEVHNAFAPDTPYISQEILYHDAVLSSVLCKFSHLNSVKAVKKIHHGKANYLFSTGVIPDGLVISENNEDEVKLAIEIELTRKSKERYVQKFDEYMKEDGVDIVFFFFDTFGVYNSYQNELKSYCFDNGFSASECKIALCYTPYISNSKKDFFESRAYGLGRESQICKLLSLDLSEEFNNDPHEDPVPSFI